VTATFFVPFVKDNGCNKIICLQRYTTTTTAAAAAADNNDDVRLPAATLIE
jgi:hypothetical protein